MKKILLTSLLFLVISVHNEASDDCCHPYFPCGSESCFIDDFSVAIDFLWWKPCIDDLVCATICFEEDNKTRIEYKGICPSWEPGVRVILGRPCFYCDWGFVGSYLYLQSNDYCKIKREGKVSCPLIHGHFTSGYKATLCDSVKGDWEFIYQEADALITYDMSCCNPCHLFQPFVGIAALWLQQELEIKLYDHYSQGKIRWDSDFWGVGLRAGVEYQYLFSKCLRFFTLVHGTMLVGNPDNEMYQLFDSELEIIDDDCCLFIPGYHIGVGFIFDTCICDVGFSLRLGYEFLDWLNLPNHRIFCGDNNAVEGGHACSSNVRTLGFHGAHFGLAVTF